MNIKKTTGMLLGKFLPPHKGHMYLIDFAKNFVDELTVVIGSLESEPIDGYLRYQWLKELQPDVNIVHLTEELPQEPSEHPDFWNIWRNALNNILPYKPDYIFASEDYGHRLAQELEGIFIPVNKQRDVIKVSGTKIRENPFGYWDYIPDVVKPYFVKKICIFGPESTGKSTLTEDLASHYKTNFIPEYARTYLEEKNGLLVKEDIPLIAKGQYASEKSLLKNANKIIFSDTDIVATTVWSNFLYNSCEEWIMELSNQKNFDLYLLTDVDVPWIPDQVRYLPEERESFMNECIKALEIRNLPYVKLSGTWDERFKLACQTVDKLLLD